MSAIRTLLCTAGVLGGMTTVAAAQVSTAPVQPSPPAAADLGQPVADRAIIVHGLLDQFEGRTDGRVPDLRWSGEGWIGSDYDKFWVKTEGFRRADGKIDDGRHEFLYSRAVSTYFDLQGGLRSDIDSRRNRNWAAFGVHGLAPLFFQVDAAVYASDQGHFAARLEGSYELLITQRLILQPEVEINLYSKSDPARLVGAGLSDIDTGLRLRYEFTRKFAPYIGVAYEGKFGQTASFARRAGESTSGVRFVFGVRSWF
ncbi:MAG: copper resistance protein B [Thiohalocapsa sp.]